MTITRPATFIFQASTPQRRFMTPLAYRMRDADSASMSTRERPDDAHAGRRASIALPCSHAPRGRHFAISDDIIGRCYAGWPAVIITLLLPCLTSLSAFDFRCSPAFPAPFHWSAAAFAAAAKSPPARYAMLMPTAAALPSFAAPMRTPLSRTPGHYALRSDIAQTT